MPGFKHFTQDRLQVVVALPAEPLERIEGSLAPAQGSSQPNQHPLVAAPAAPQAQAPELGDAQAPASPAAGFWRARLAVGGRPQPLAQALGAGCRSPPTPTPTGGAPPERPPRAAEQ